MKIMIMSDLHFENHADSGKSFIQNLDPEGIDVLILAGDISTKTYLLDTISALCNRFNNSQILYVVGNHEFWGVETRQEIVDLIVSLTDKFKNLHWLDNDTFEYMGQRFIGSPLWFPKSDMTIIQQKRWSDFNNIGDFNKWVYLEWLKSHNYLYSTVQPNDIVITHYLPCFACIHQRYFGSTSNCFFYGQADGIIEDKKPKLWIHGHTHESLDFKYHETRIICNPYGYEEFSMTNENFINGLTIEV